jgi:hypothetical protein
MAAAFAAYCFGGHVKQPHHEAALAIDGLPCGASGASMRVVH